jgi:hypothetical protein
VDGMAVTIIVAGFTISGYTGMTSSIVSLEEQSYSSTSFKPSKKSCLNFISLTSNHCLHTFKQQRFAFDHSVLSKYFSKSNSSSFEDDEKDLELTSSSFGSQSSDFSGSSPFIRTATSQRASFL